MYLFTVYIALPLPRQLQADHLSSVMLRALTNSVAPIIGSAIGYRPIIAIVQYIGCLSDSTYRYSIYAHALYEPRVAESANI